MRSVLRERRKEMLRNEILDTTMELLETRGYTTMSMDELANSVGISKPTLYSHFATKDELVVESLIRQMERVSEMLAAVDQATSPLRRLILLLQKVVCVPFDKGEVAMRPWVPELFNLICTHPRATASMRRIELLVQKLVEEAIVAGEIDASYDAQTVTRVFFVMFGTMRVPLITGTPMSDLHTAASTIVRMFERSVRPVRV